MAQHKLKSQSNVANKVYATLSIIAAVVLLVVGLLALWASTFTTTMVKTELAAQKIYFPAKGSPALDPQVYPDLQQYAGQLVDTAPEARAYANGYIGRHLEEVAGGKVYAEVSAAAMKDPTNAVLQKQKASLFQGETLRGILLSTGYAYGTIGSIARIAAYVLFIGSAIMLFGAGIFSKKLRG